MASKCMLTTFDKHNKSTVNHYKIYQRGGSNR